jgi:hypothetical protein
MAKTFAGKSLSGGLNKVADSVYGPIRRLKEINRALKKSLKVGTITEAELRRLLEEGEKIQLTLRKVPIDEMDTVIKTTKNVVKGVKVGKDVALVAGSAMNPGFGTSTKIINESEALITDVEDTLESSKDLVKEVKKEYKGLSAEMIQMAEYAKAHREAKKLNEGQFPPWVEKYWNNQLAINQTHLAYIGDDRQSDVMRDYIHADPRRYAKVLADAKTHGHLRYVRGNRKEDPILDTRVDVEIKMNWLMIDWILNYKDFQDIKKQVYERDKLMYPHMYSGNNPEPTPAEKEALQLEQNVDRREMEKLKEIVTRTRAEYDSNAQTLMQLGFQAETTDIDPTGRILGYEYNTIINSRQQQLLDDSVGEIPLDVIDVNSRIIIKNEESKLGGVTESYSDYMKSESRHGERLLGGGQTVFWVDMEETNINGEKHYISNFIVQNRYGTQVIEQEALDAEGNIVSGIEAVGDKNKGRYASLVEWTQNVFGG